MNNTIELPIIAFNQPVGSFLLSVMRVPDLIRISRADPRKFDNISMETVGGIQREPSKKRIREIAAYARTVDAAFPTVFLLALDDECYEINEHNIKINGDQVADIVDGQHRILGLKKADIQDEFVVPVVFLLETTEEQRALIFATINGKQTKVPASIIYDLFGVTETRSPYKTAHEIARALNSMENSPWFKRLKMLGRKTPGSLESLSQGTFVKFLLPHISKKPDVVRNMLKIGKKPPVEDRCIFSEYFVNKKDSVILKILMNVFQAARNTWTREWDDPVFSILTKTNGFSGIMRALPAMMENGKQRGDLSIEYFESVFDNVKRNMISKSIELTSQCFDPSSRGEIQFSNMIQDVLREF